MPVHSDVNLALEALEASAFAVNDQWKRAHSLAQSHEGVPVFDAIHALCHRIEGDTSNAGYWDRRAGTDFGGKGHAEEWKSVSEMAEALRT